MVRPLYPSSFSQVSGGDTRLQREQQATRRGSQCSVTSCPLTALASERTLQGTTTACWGTTSTRQISQNPPATIPPLPWQQWGDTTGKVGPSHCNPDIKNSGSRGNTGWGKGYPYLYCNPDINEQWLGKVGYPRTPFPTAVLIAMNSGWVRWYRVK